MRLRGAVAGLEVKLWCGTRTVMTCHRQLGMLWPAAAFTPREQGAASQHHIAPALPEQPLQGSRPPSLPPSLPLFAFLLPQARWCTLWVTTPTKSCLA